MVAQLNSAQCIWNWKYKGKTEQAKKDAAGTFYGLGHTVEEKKPAIYNANGKPVKPAKIKVSRSSAAKGINGMIGGGFA